MATNRPREIRTDRSPPSMALNLTPHEQQQAEVVVAFEFLAAPGHLVLDRRGALPQCLASPTAPERLRRMARSLCVPGSFSGRCPPRAPQARSGGLYERLASDLGCGGRSPCGQDLGGDVGHDHPDDDQDHAGAGLGHQQRDDDGGQREPQDRDHQLPPPARLPPAVSLKLADASQQATSNPQEDRRERRTTPGTA